MSWGWNAGYKFLRLEGKRGREAFVVHVGSTGCEGTFGHVTRCARPNRAEIEIVSTGGTYALDVARLAGGDAPVRCMGDGADAACTETFAQLGLETGEARGVSRVFVHAP
jgi:hypothetical protein